MTQTLERFEPSSDRPQGAAPKPVTTAPRSLAAQVFVYVGVILPFVALLVAAPGAALYLLGLLGVNLGYPPFFTPGSYKAKPALRVALAIAGSLAVQGPVI